MAMFCLPKELAEKIKKSIKSGELSPKKLMDMGSAERRGFLQKIVGDDAKEINLLFEKKMLLKNQEKGLYDWAREITGLSKAEKEAFSQKIKETYAEKKRRIYEPMAEERFLDEMVSDAYSKKFKTDISLEEAHKITELSSKAAESKELVNEDKTWGNGSEADRLNYGVKWGNDKVALDNYVNGLKLEATTSKWLNPLKPKVGGRIGAVIQDLKNSFNFIADNSRAILASLDNSFWFRQGIKTATNPKYTKTWFKHFTNSFIDIGKTIKGEGWTKGKSFKENLKAMWGSSIRKGDAIQDAIKAEIYSRKNFLNGRYEKGKKLDVGIAEEEFPTSLPEKIPILGRLFKASEVAYTSGAMRMRVDLADQVYKLADKAGVDMDSKFEIGSINELVNSLTGRGRIGRIGETGQAFVNKTFFSLKFFKSNWDFLTLHTGSDLSPFARKLAAKNLANTAIAMGLTLGIVDTFFPNAVEWNPRSSDFGKIKIGDTRFDITGGFGGLLILTARLATGEKKSTTSGVIQALGGDYGQTSKKDTLIQFTENKLSPVMSAIKNLMEEKDWDGNEITLLGELQRMSTPIPIANFLEVKDNEEAANVLLTVIADGIGIGSATYGIQLPDQELLYKEFKGMPEEDRLEALRELKINDPKMYEKVIEVKDSENEGLNSIDRYIKETDIKDGERATFIYNEALKKGGKEEQKTYLKELSAKGLLDEKTTGYLFELRDLGYIESLKPQNVSKKEYINTRGTIDLLSDYARAFKVNPKSALITLFTREELGIVQGNLVEMQRMYGEGLEGEKYSFDPEKGTTQGIKKEMMEDKGISWEEQGDYKLEHILPVSAGGGNGEDNLKIVPNADWAMYTPIDIIVGKAVKGGILTTAEAEKLMIDYKISGTITAEAVMASL